MTGIMLHLFPYPYVDVEFIAFSENTILAEYTKDTIFLCNVFIPAQNHRINKSKTAKKPSFERKEMVAIGDRLPSPQWSINK